MLSNRLIFFLLGAITAGIVFSLALWVKTTDFLHEGGHRWEVGDDCGCLEKVFAARPLHRKDSAYYLGILFSTGECVHQNLPTAEKFFNESGHPQAKDMGRMLFSMAQTIIEEHPDAIEEETRRNRILNLLKRCKELSFTPSDTESFRVTEKQKNFLLSYFKNKT